MKTFERIFLYTVLAILVFYVFLVDNNVESQVAIQEEIRARSISIVNDEGQEVVILWAHEDGGGMIGINNKTGTSVTYMGTYEDSGAISINNKAGIRVVNIKAGKFGGGMVAANKYGTPVVAMGANEDSGMIIISNKAGNPVAITTVYKDDGLMEVYNRQGDIIGNLP